VMTHAEPASISLRGVRHNAPNYQTPPSETHTHTHTHTHLTALCKFVQDYPVKPVYQKGKTNLDFTEARDSEWQWLQLGHMQVCTSLQTDNHSSTPPLSFLLTGCPSCRPTNSVKALKVVSPNLRRIVTDARQNGPFKSTNAP